MVWRASQILLEDLAILTAGDEMGVSCVFSLA